MPARWAPYITANVILESQFRPAERMPDSCIKLYLESQFRPALRVPGSRAKVCLESQFRPATRMPYISAGAHLESQFRPAMQVPYVSVSACLTSYASPALRVPDSRVEANLEYQCRPALRVPDSRVDACLTSQAIPATRVPDSRVEARHLGWLPMIQWKCVWQANLSQPGGSLSVWPAPVRLGWLGVPIIEGPQAGGQSDIRNWNEKCPENPEVAAGGYSLVCHFAGPGSAGQGISCLSRNSDTGEARLRWAGLHW